MTDITTPAVPPAKPVSGSDPHTISLSLGPRSSAVQPFTNQNLEGNNNTCLIFAWSGTNPQSPANR